MLVNSNMNTITRLVFLLLILGSAWVYPQDFYYGMGEYDMGHDPQDSFINSRDDDQGFELGIDPQDSFMDSRDNNQYAPASSMENRRDTELYNAPPKLVISESDYFVQKGEDVNISCAVEETTQYGRPAAQMIWTKDGSPVDHETDIQYIHKAGHLYILMVKRVTEEMLGDYTCHAMNGNGKSEATIHLKGRGSFTSNYQPPQSHTSDTGNENSGSCSELPALREEVTSLKTVIYELKELVLEQNKMLHQLTMGSGRRG